MATVTSTILWSPSPLPLPSNDADLTTSDDAVAPPAQSVTSGAHVNIDDVIPAAVAAIPDLLAAADDLTGDDTDDTTRESLDRRTATNVDASDDDDADGVTDVNDDESDKRS